MTSSVAAPLSVDDCLYDSVDDLMVALYEKDKGVTRMKLLSLFVKEAHDRTFNNYDSIKNRVLLELPDWNDEFNVFSSKEISDWILGYICMDE